MANRSSMAKAVPITFEIDYVNEKIKTPYSLAVIGSTDELGKWDTNSCLEAKNIDGKWVVDVDLPKNSTIEWNWIVKSLENPSLVLAREGHSRKSSVGNCGCAYKVKKWNETEVMVNNQRVDSDAKIDKTAPKSKRKQKEPRSQLAEVPDSVHTKHDNNGLPPKTQSKSKRKNSRVPIVDKQSQSMSAITPKEKEKEQISSSTQHANRSKEKILPATCGQLFNEESQNLKPNNNTTVMLEQEKISDFVLKLNDKEIQENNDKVSYSNTKITETESDIQEDSDCEAKISNSSLPVKNTTSDSFQTDSDEYKVSSYVSKDNSILDGSIKLNYESDLNIRIDNQDQEFDSFKTKSNTVNKSNTVSSLPNQSLINSIYLQSHTTSRNVEEILAKAEKALSKSSRAINAAEEKRTAQVNKFLNDTAPSCQQESNHHSQISGHSTREADSKPVTELFRNGPPLSKVEKIYFEKDIKKWSSDKKFSNKKPNDFIIDSANYDLNIVDKESYKDISTKLHDKQSFKKEFQPQRCARYYFTSPKRRKKFDLQELELASQTEIPKCDKENDQKTYQSSSYDEVKTYMHFKMCCNKNEAKEIGIPNDIADNSEKESNHLQKVSDLVTEFTKREEERKKKVYTKPDSIPIAEHLAKSKGIVLEDDLLQSNDYFIKKGSKFEVKNKYKGTAKKQIKKFENDFIDSLEFNENSLSDKKNSKPTEKKTHFFKKWCIPSRKNEDKIISKENEKSPIQNTVKSSKPLQSPLNNLLTKYEIDDSEIIESEYEDTYKSLKYRETCRQACLNTSKVKGRSRSKSKSKDPTDIDNVPMETAKIIPLEPVEDIKNLEIEANQNVEECFKKPSKYSMFKKYYKDQDEKDDKYRQIAKSGMIKYDKIYSEDDIPSAQLHNDIKKETDSMHSNNSEEINTDDHIFAPKLGYTNAKKEEMRLDKVKKDCIDELKQNDRFKDSGAKEKLIVKENNVKIDYILKNNFYNAPLSSKIKNKYDSVVFDPKKIVNANKQTIDEESYETVKYYKNQTVIPFLVLDADGKQNANSSSDAHYMSADYTKIDIEEHGVKSNHSNMSNSSSRDCSEHSFNEIRENKTDEKLNSLKGICSVFENNNFIHDDSCVESRCLEVQDNNLSQPEQNSHSTQLLEHDEISDKKPINSVSNGSLNYHTVEEAKALLDQDGNKLSNEEDICNTNDFKKEIEFIEKETNILIPKCDLDDKHEIVENKRTLSVCFADDQIVERNLEDDTNSLGINEQLINDNEGKYENDQTPIIQIETEFKNDELENEAIYQDSSDDIFDDDNHMVCDRDKNEELFKTGSLASKNEDDEQELVYDEDYEKISDNFIENSLNNEMVDKSLEFPEGDMLVEENSDPYTEYQPRFEDSETPDNYSFIDKNQTEDPELLFTSVQYENIAEETSDAYRPETSNFFYDNKDIDLDELANDTLMDEALLKSDQEEDLGIILNYPENDISQNDVIDDYDVVMEDSVEIVKKPVDEIKEEPISYDEGISDDWPMGIAQNSLFSFLDVHFNPYRNF